MKWLGKQSKELGKKTNLTETVGKEQLDLCFYCTLISYSTVITRYG